MGLNLPENWSGTGSWGPFADWAKKVSKALNRVTVNGDNSSQAGEFTENGLVINTSSNLGGSSVEVTVVTGGAFDPPNIVLTTTVLTFEGGLLVGTGEGEDITIEAEPCGEE